ncbi:hypothetical protein OHB14_25655 [Streptomyces sp. NBC_01613]
MAEQRHEPGSDQTNRNRETRRRRVANGAFLAGLVAGLVFFGFFPGLPHVIDWGAVAVSLAVGGLARWACQSWMTRTNEKKLQRR